MGKVYWLAPTVFALIENSARSMSCADGYSKIEFYRQVNENTLDAFGFRPATDWPEKYAESDLQRLRLAGGEGRVVEFTTGHKWTDPDIPARKYQAVLLSTPPKKLFGRNFENFFEEMEAAGVPVLMGENPEQRYLLQAGKNKMGSMGGTVLVQGAFTDGAKPFILFRSRGSTDMLNVHELQHVKDLALDYKKFMDTLPEPTPALAKHIQERKGKLYRELDESLMKRSDHASAAFTARAEANASLASVQSVLSKSGIKQVIEDGELDIFREEIVNTLKHSAKFAYHSMWVNPLDPNSLVAAVRMGSAAGMAGTGGFMLINYTFVGGKWVLERGINYVADRTSGSEKIKK